MASGEARPPRPPWELGPRKAEGDPLFTGRAVTAEEAEKARHAEQGSSPADQSGHRGNGVGPARCPHAVLRLREA
ncbi:hypothetical protein ACRAWF_21065, partial [Streptomyces sp. L7]